MTTVELVAIRIPYWQTSWRQITALVTELARHYRRDRASALGYLT
jgi:hypothetical protein